LKCIKEVAFEPYFTKEASFPKAVLR
jgi:hypothetical protein